MLSRTPTTVVALCIVAVLVVTGPLIGVDAVRPQPTTLGDGTVTVSSVQIETADIRVTHGRFGANVSYLRVPEASVTVESVTGRPRLLYQVSVPELGISLEAERILISGQPGRYEFGPGDSAIDPATVTRDTYDGTVRVRAQSFEMSEVVVSRNVTVRVAR